MKKTAHFLNYLVNWLTLGFYSIWLSFSVGASVATETVNFLPIRLFIESGLDYTELNTVTYAFSEKDIQATLEKVQVDYSGLKAQIGEVLMSTDGEYGIYVKDFSNDTSFNINGDNLFAPASIFKVPLAMIIMKDIEQGKFLLTNQFMLMDYHKFASYEYMAKFEEGTLFTIDELLNYMLKLSDNTAQNVLYFNVGSTDEYNQRFKEELGLQNTAHTPFITTPYDINKAFTMLYDASFLTKEHSDYLLNILANTDSSFDDRIVAGVPEGTRVSHKIGNMADVWQDAGIVYGPKTNYLLVVLNQGVYIEDARNVIENISQICWNYFEN